jgi:hypothetical protein
MKVTVPFTVPAPGATGVTVAVSVTAWPDTEGFAEEVNVVCVAIRLTTWVTIGEVLLAKLASPA